MMVGTVSLVDAATSSAGHQGGRCMPQGDAELLKALSTAGISQEDKETLAAALQDLQRIDTPGMSPALTHETWQAGPAAQAGTVPVHSNTQQKAKAPSKPPEASILEGTHKQLQERLEMATSIMRKLYVRKVQLEKEVALLKAGGNTRSAGASDILDLERNIPASTSASGAGHGTMAQGPPKTAPSLLTTRGSATDSARPSTGAAIQGILDEKDTVIEQQQGALASLQRQVAVLKGALVQQGEESSHAQAAETLLADATAQAAIHEQNHKQMRRLYQKLLNKRVSLLAPRVSEDSRALLLEMKARLDMEVRERDVEAAMFSSKLFDCERERTDWYVERKLMQQQVASLNAELANREHANRQTQSQMAVLLAKVRQLEQQNTELQSVPEQQAQTTLPSQEAPSHDAAIVGQLKQAGENGTMSS